MPKQFRAELVSSEAVLPLRTRHRAEMNCQIVHDSIHRRNQWTQTYQLSSGAQPVGFVGVAIAGPWKDKPTIFEYYVLPEYRTEAFQLFQVFREASDAGFFEVQSSDVLLNVILHTFGRQIESEKIVFADGKSTSLPSRGATLRSKTAKAEIQAAMDARQGGGEWGLELEGVELGKGGILFHYNRPYGDIYMEVAETHRRQGWGALLVQELKRQCYELGAIPCARCHPQNVASRQTLQRAGFVPVAHILLGTLDPNSSLAC